MVKQNSLDKFGARSAYLTREWLVAVQTPADGVKPVLDALSANIPLQQGTYDQCLYVSGPGQQRFHSVAGSRAGFEGAVPGSSTVEITFSIPQDAALLDRVFETVFAVPCNQEPAVRIVESWGSRCDYLNERENPHRYWNRAAVDVAQPQAAATACA